MLLAVRVLRPEAVDGLRRVVLRFVVVAGFGVPGVLVLMSLLHSGLDLVCESIEHVFVHDRLARVTDDGMKDL